MYPYVVHYGSVIVQAPGVCCCRTENSFRHARAISNLKFGNNSIQPKLQQWYLHSKFYSLYLVFCHYLLLYFTLLCNYVKNSSTPTFKIKITLRRQNRTVFIACLNRFLALNRVVQACLTKVGWAACHVVLRHLSN